jgi:hypothetical protein
MECDRCFAHFNELFEAIENFLRLVESAKQQSLMISPNAFTITDLKNAFNFGFKLSAEDKEKIWERIQKKLAEKTHENKSAKDGKEHGEKPF